MKPVSALFKEEVHVLNIGLEQFYDDLKSSGCPCVQLDWRIPSADSDIEALLLKLI